MREIRYVKSRDLSSAREPLDQPCRITRDKFRDSRKEAAHAKRVPHHPRCLRRHSHVVALALILAPGFAGSVTAGSDDNGGDQFRANLTGSQEVTTPPGGVDTDTVGKARFELNDARTELEFELEVEDGVRVTQAHIHCAPAGSNGPIVIFLAGFHDKGWDVDGDWIGDATATDANITNNACGSTLAEIADGNGRGQDLR